MLSRNSQSEHALELLSRIAVRYDWSSEAKEAFESLIRTHPSCSNLQAASSYFAATTQFVRAAALEPQLQRCAPESLAFANELAVAGRHTEAAKAAAEVARQWPLNREALELEIRERLLSGDPAKAATLAETLAALAPNSESYTRAVAHPDILPEGNSSNAIAVDIDSEFYRAFRRDGLRLVQDNAGRKYSGGPAVILLNDKVALLNDDGSGAIYVHRITRVLDRDGIVQYGEVTIPQGAHVLELRTIKADLTLAEPELNQHKATISMPALAAGDSIEQEYIIRFPDSDALEANPEVFEFAFGSFGAPILFSKFVLMAPPDTALGLQLDAPRETARSLSGGITARIWERDNIAQSISEPDHAAVRSAAQGLPRSSGFRSGPAARHRAGRGPRSRSSRRSHGSDIGAGDSRF